MKQDNDNKKNGSSNEEAEIIVSLLLKK